MTKKVILMLFILGLINIPAMAENELQVQTIKLEDNTIDLNLEDMVKNMQDAPELIEFDVPAEPFFKLENTEKALDDLQEQVQKVQEVKNTVEEQPQEKIQEAVEVKEAVEEQVQEEVQNAEEVIEAVEEQVQEEVQKAEEVKPSKTQTGQSEGEISDDNGISQDDEIKLDSSIRGEAIISSNDFSNAPKWEEFCEQGYENAQLKEKENILNIINFVDAERTKSNYWAERRANFEKAVNQCNSMSETARNYCYEGVRKSENERNEIYERQRKQINYKNQGIKIDK